ncbi:hypothetical protein DL96DRAFT_1642902 [Flagelloscypha sp. PMI_526]|nr:hypothetical protein DL96DRAFT_1642902 [Flagelloscypha sp. PMI_526]
MYAATNGHLAIVRLLLERNDVQADSRDEDGTSPLSYATENGHIDIVKLILRTLQQSKMKLRLQKSSSSHSLTELTESSTLERLESHSEEKSAIRKSKSFEDMSVRATQ